MFRCFEDAFEAVPKGQVKKVRRGKFWVLLEVPPHLSLLMTLLPKTWRYLGEV